MKKQLSFFAVILASILLFSLCALAASEYMTATKAENPPIAMKITWHGESGQAQVFVRPVGEKESNFDDGLYDFHNIGGSMYLPMRKICERLGEIVDWDPVLGRAYVVRGENRIDMTGKLINGTTFIKIRDFEKLGYLVDYYVDGEGKPWATLFARPTYDVMNKYTVYDEYNNYRETLTNTYNKLTKDKELTVAYLGGSITVGRNYESNCWRTMVDAWFKEQYPDANVKMIRAGIGGTGSSYGAYRINEDVLAHNPDLVFVEFAANDNHFGAKYGKHAVTQESIKEFYETIILKIYEHNPEADIVMLYTQTRDMAKYNQTESTEAHEELAEYYNINSVYFGSYLNDYIDGKSLVSTDYIYDGLHPTDKGYAVMFEVLKEMLANTITGTKDSATVAKVLPEKTKSAHVRLDSYLVPKEDITLDSNWTASGLCGKTTTPGALLSCKFTGDEVAVYTYIRGTAGAIDFRIDGGEWIHKSLSGSAGNDRIPLISGLEYGEHTLEIKCWDKLIKGHTVDIKCIMIN